MDDLLDASDPRKKDELSILRAGSREAAAAAAQVYARTAAAALLGLLPAHGLSGKELSAAKAASELLRDLCEAQLGRTF